MKESELKKELKEFVKGAMFIRKYQLANFIGAKDPNTVNKYLSGLEKVGKDYYFINDVVKALLNN